MSNIDGLASEWLELKAQEKKITAQRHAVEEQITEALDAKGEGSVSHKLENHKVTLTQPVSRKIDSIIWDKVKDKIPESMHPVKMALTVDSVGCRYLAEKEHRMWAKIAKAFETKPGKIGVKVEVLL